MPKASTQKRNISQSRAKKARDPQNLLLCDVVNVLLQLAILADPKGEILLKGPINRINDFLDQQVFWTPDEGDVSRETPEDFPEKEEF